MVALERELTREQMIDLTIVGTLLDIIANVMRYFCEGYTPLFRGIGAPQIDNFFMEGLHPYPQKYKFVIFSKTASKHSRRFDAWQ